MHSEKLKELIKAKTPLKFRIKDPEQSKELQNLLFSLDIFWGVKKVKRVRYIESYLVAK